MSNFKQIFVVIDQRNKDRILAIFDNNETAKQYALEENGHVYNRLLRSKAPDKNSRYMGYIT